ncbi:MAG: GIY-YIG nuclease family protein [Winogradskyella sp.]|uniref:GIY-YIG nuclease family protein n=1 Tax=Winogradskyella sp. TaxID=1883156 RepID=UPI00385E7B77
MEKGFTYIPSNKNKTVLYVGGSKYLKRRVALHKAGKAVQFTKRYNLNELIYFEVYPDFHDAFSREKQLKNWRKEWKWNLIKSMNPELKDL